jgi:hypothetical protein
VNQLKLIAVAVAIVTASMAMLSALQFHRFQMLLQEVVTERISVVARDVIAAVEQSLAYGIPLSDAANLAGVLKRAAAGEASVIAMRLVDTDLSPGTVLHSSEEGLAGGLDQVPVRLQAKAGKSNWSVDEHERIVTLGWPIRDNIGGVAATLVTVVDRTSALEAVERARVRLLTLWIWFTAALAGCAAACVAWTMQRLQRELQRGETVIETGVPLAGNSQILAIATDIARHSRA